MKQDLRSCYKITYSGNTEQRKCQHTIEYPFFRFIIGCCYCENIILFWEKRPILAGTHWQLAIFGKLSIPWPIAGKGYVELSVAISMTSKQINLTVNEWRHKTRGRHLEERIWHREEWFQLSGWFPHPRKYRRADRKLKFRKWINFRPFEAEIGNPRNVWRCWLWRHLKRIQSQN